MIPTVVHPDGSSTVSLGDPKSQDECDHCIGTDVVDYEYVLAYASDTDQSQIVLQFKFCPDCGKQLRE